MTTQFTEALRARGGGPTPSRTLARARGGIGFVLPIMLTVLWEVAVRSGRWNAAPPSEVFAHFVRLVFDGTLPVHALVSLGRLVSGFFLGTVLGLAVGCAVGLSMAVERAVSPTIQLLAPVPVIAWIPVVIVIFGIGEPSKIAIVALGTFFVVYVGTVQGVRGVDAKLVEVARVYGKPTMTLVRQVLIPAALPTIITALHVALGLSWIMLLAAEIIASAKGLGWFLWDSRNFSRSADMFSAMIAIGLLGRLSDLLLTRVELRALRWRRTFEGQ